MKSRTRRTVLVFIATMLLVVGSAPAPVGAQEEEAQICLNQHFTLMIGTPAHKKSLIPVEGQGPRACVVLTHALWEKLALVGFQPTSSEFKAKVLDLQIWLMGGNFTTNLPDYECVSILPPVVKTANR